MMNLSLKAISTIVALFSLSGGQTIHSVIPHPPLPVSISYHAAVHVKKSVRRLSGKYTKMVFQAAKKMHVSPLLIAAVVHVENGGDLQGASHRVSDAGAIGVMQLMPVTAWNVLRVNPWNPQQNIDGGAHFLAMLLKQFHDNTRLALMAYNAGPTWIAQGGRPYAAVLYAQKVLAAEKTAL